MPNSKLETEQGLELVKSEGETDTTLIHSTSKKNEKS